MPKKPTMIPKETEIIQKDPKEISSLWSNPDSAPIRASLVNLLALRVKSLEKERRIREKQARAQSILSEVLRERLVGDAKTVQEKIESDALIEAKDNIGSANGELLGSLKEEVARRRLKVMASTRCPLNPKLTEVQARILACITQVVSERPDKDEITSWLYQRERKPSNPLTFLIGQLERKAKEELLSDLISRVGEDELVEILAGRLFHRELSWLMREINAVLEVVETITPYLPDEQKNQAVVKIVHSGYEMRIRQSGDPVNPSQIRQLITEACLLNKPLQLVLIKCLCHSYKTGQQEVVSIYDKNTTLRDKERQFLNQLLSYKKIFEWVGITPEIIVVVADTDIPYQREEPTEGEKWQVTQIQIRETRELHRHYGITALSLMEAIVNAGVKGKHDEVYQMVKLTPLRYIPSVYLERRINKRYEKYHPLEGMTRAEARRVVINSYAQEAALGVVWDSLWGENCLHLVYKTTYLAAAIEVCRNPTREPRKNIPTIFSSGQGKIDSDGLEHDQ